MLARSFWKSSLPSFEKLTSKHTKTSQDKHNPSMFPRQWVTVIESKLLIWLVVVNRGILLGSSTESFLSVLASSVKKAQLSLKLIRINSTTGGGLTSSMCFISSWMLSIQKLREVNSRLPCWFWFHLILIYLFFSFFSFMACLGQTPYPIRPRASSAKYRGLTEGAGQLRWRQSFWNCKPGQFFHFQLRFSWLLLTDRLIMILALFKHELTSTVSSWRLKVADSSLVKSSQVSFW